MELYDRWVRYYNTDPDFPGITLEAIARLKYAHLYVESQEQKDTLEGYLLIMGVDLPVSIEHRDLGSRSFITMEHYQRVYQHQNMEPSNESPS